MRLQLGTGQEAREPDAEALEEGIRSLVRSPNAFAVLSRSDTDDYIQTTLQQKNGFTVEYRDCSKQRHYRLSDVPLDTVIRLFQLFRNRRQDWKRSFSWKDVSGEFDWPGVAGKQPAYQSVRALPPFTILARNTEQPFVVVCVKCNVPCELQRPGLLNTAGRTLLAGGIGFFAAALDSWWRCNGCGKKYRQGDFKKGRIQQQRYTASAMPTFEPR